MVFLKVKEIAGKWGVSERTVRNYCNKNLIKGAYLNGKTWMIPANSLKPERKNKAQKNEVLETLLREKKEGIKGGLYHKIQIELTYNSNHIEGSKLSHDETRYIYETNTIGLDRKSVNTDDIVETSNHFGCINMVLENVNNELNETFIKGLHYMLKHGTSDSRKDYFKIGEYKKLANEVGGHTTAKPEEVKIKMQELLKEYNKTKVKTLDEILDFHYKFERIHPFQDGNGRVGRLILFKECLRNNIVPFIIDEELKMFYYRGLNEWKYERGFLRETCLAGQDKFKSYLEYFEIPY